MNSRALLVRIRAKHIAIDVIVAHAPHGDHPQEEQLTWWADLQGMIDKRKDKETTLLGLFDANAHMDFCDNVICGTAIVKKGNFPALCFKTFLRTDSLCATYTFAQCAKDPLLPTFIARGASQVLDYTV